MIDNPFKQVYDTLWKFPRRSIRLMELVKPGNIVDFDKAQDVKSATSTDDFPELALLQAGGNADYQSNSSMCMMIRRYSFQITTGSVIIHPRLNEISWELYRSLLGWDTLLCSLYWPDNSSITHNFVRKCTTFSIDEGFQIEEDTREIKGWTAVWTCEIEMWFNTNQLRLDEDTEVLF